MPLNVDKINTGTLFVDGKQVAAMAPSVYSLVRGKNDFFFQPFGLTWSLTGKDGPKLEEWKFLEADLTYGNYWSINITMPTKLIRLPETYKDNLAILNLYGVHNENESLKINLSDFKNIDWCVINENYQSPTGKIRPNYIITDKVINLPKNGALWLGLSDDSPQTEFENKKIEIRPYSVQFVNIQSRNITDVSLNYENFEFLTFDPDTNALKYESNVNVGGSPNLTGLTIQNVNLPNFSEASNFVFGFYNNNFSQTTVDSILQQIDNLFPNNVNNPSYLYLGNVLPGGEELYFDCCEDLIVGQKYVIKELQPGDDFSNVGYTADNVEFVATNTTPNNFSFGTKVFYGSTFGTNKNVEFVSKNFSIPDGSYEIGINKCNYKVTFKLDEIQSIEFLKPINYNTLDYVNKEITLTGFSLSKFDNDGRVIWQNNGSDEIIFRVTEIYRNAVPTNGTSNINYLSLVSKGWEVHVATV